MTATTAATESAMAAPSTVSHPASASSPTSARRSPFFDAVVSATRPNRPAICRLPESPLCAARQPPARPASAKITAASLLFVVNRYGALALRILQALQMQAFNSLQGSRADIVGPHLKLGTHIIR